MPPWLAFALGLLATPALFAVTCIILLFIQEWRTRKQANALMFDVLMMAKRDPKFAAAVRSSLEQPDPRKAPN